MKKFPSKRKIIMILTIAILLFTSIILSGCTQKVRYPVEHLSFSYDGTKLVSVTYPVAGYYETDIDQSSGHDIQVWDVSSNKIIWKQFYSSDEYYYHSLSRHNYDNVYLSPDGRYLSTPLNDYDILLNQTVMLDNPIERVPRNNLFALKNSSSSIDVYYGVNSSKIKTISFNMTIEPYPEMKTSPTRSEVALIPENKTSVYLINLTSDNLIPLENTSFNFSEEFSKYNGLPSYDNKRYLAYADNTITWSKDGEKIALTFIEYKGDYVSSNHIGSTIGIYSCHILIWERKNGLLLEGLELTITNIYDSDKELDKIGIPSLSPNFESYGYLHTPRSTSKDKNNGNYEQELFEIYNLSNGKNILNIEVSPHYDLVYEWSNDQKIATGGANGIIYIYDASTGEKISTLHTPYHTIAVPGFELILVVCAIAMMIFWKRKKKN